jgi:CRISPR system Cascade subunit CasE
MSALYLIRLPVDLATLNRWAVDRGLGLTEGGGIDEGLTLHHLLSEAFGKGVLQPFRLIVPPKGTTASLYAYTGTAPAMLAGNARAVAPPEHLAAIGLDQLVDKAMPEDWRAGRRLGFELRARPVRRLLKPLAHADGEHFAKGDEVDAFLIEAARRYPEGPPEDVPPATREAVYIEWLAHRLEGAARLVEGTVRLTSFRRHRAERGRTTLEGPDALLRGDLEIVDPDAFRTALEKGVGRHRAYGFGMLMLRPAQAG